MALMKNVSSHVVVLPWAPPHGKYIHGVRAIRNVEPGQEVDVPDGYALPIELNGGAVRKSAVDMLGLQLELVGEDKDRVLTIADQQRIQLEYSGKGSALQQAMEEAGHAPGIAEVMAKQAVAARSKAMK